MALSAGMAGFSKIKKNGFSDFFALHQYRLLQNLGRV